MLTRLPLLALTLGCALASVACVTTVSDDGAGGAGNNGQGGDGAGTTSSQGGSTSDGGAGQGGSAQGGAGEGGAGGGAECVGHEGTGVLEATCTDDVSGGLAECADESIPPPRLICARGFELFSEGARENLITCLLDIGAIPADNCGTDGETAVETCITAMYDESCVTENTDIVGETGICAELTAACTEANLGTFDTTNCLADLNVFSEDGLNEYITCTNDNTDLDCAELHDTCFTEVFTY